MSEPVDNESRIRQIAFLGDYLPRKCGIATFTSDLLTAVAAEQPQSQCFAVPVNDIEGRYRYSDVVRFEGRRRRHVPHPPRRSSSRR
jgi:hypothetical protein